MKTEQVGDIEEGTIVFLACAIAAVGADFFNPNLPEAMWLVTDDAEIKQESVLGAGGFYVTQEEEWPYIVNLATGQLQAVPPTCLVVRAPTRERNIEP